MKAFKTSARQGPGNYFGVNERRVLSVLVSSSTSAAARGHVRESKMRQFGELEAVIMDRLWQWGRPALVREVLDDLRKERPLAYTTVMTVMENLHRKGWLRRHRDGRAWRYEPAGSSSGYTAALMGTALATSTDRRTALTHFVLQMSPHDAALLQQALDRAHPRLEEGGTQ
jgi:predicted transcriptional regulator